MAASGNEPDIQLEAGRELEREELGILRLLVPVLPKVSSTLLFTVL